MFPNPHIIRKPTEKQNRALKLLRTCLRKHCRDPWLALLDFRNTPTQGMQTSPVQRLMSRRTKTLVPIATSLLKPEVADGATEKIELKRQKAKSYHDKQAKRLPELETGQEVRIAPNLRGKPWNLGTCTENISSQLAHSLNQPRTYSKSQCQQLQSRYWEEAKEWLRSLIASYRLCLIINAELETWFRLLSMNIEHWFDFTWSNTFIFVNVSYIILDHRFFYTD